MLAKTYTLAALATLVKAHMLMNNPVPYGKSSLTNAPLLADGSDFPCKIRSGVYDAQGASNVYKQGSTQTLSFTGQAVHGGGSCQISITTDKQPNKNSVWKVIKSIEGGCPAKGQAGNMGDNADAEDPFKYEYTIPAELAAGDYTIAWTWFNKIGNREMYMNCAPLQVTGSGGSKDHLSSLPDMFVANIGNQCQVPSAQDLVFPAPGKDVDRFNGATQAWGQPTGPGCMTAAADAPPSTPTGGNGGSPAPTDGSGGNGGSPAPTGGNGGNGGSPAPTNGSGGFPAPAPSPSTGSPIAPSPAPSPPSGNEGGSPASPSYVQPPEAQPSEAQPSGGQGAGVPGGVFITASRAEPSPPAATSAPPTNPTPDNGSGSGSNPPDSGSGDGSVQNPGSDQGSPSQAFAEGAACTSEGEWNCVNGSTFQRCASGAWTAAQALTSGVKCTPGQSADLGISSRRGRKVMRRALRHRV